MKYRILIPSDHAWRDVPGLSLLRVQLEKLMPEADVRVVDIHLLSDSIELFKPNCIVINHLHEPNRNKLIDTVRRRGGLCVVLPSEGRPNTDGQLAWATQDWPHRLCDLFCSWSDEFATHLPKDILVKTTGCPRFDFYYPPFNSLIEPKEVVCAKYDLDPKRPIITVASSFPQAKFYKHGQDFLKKDWDALGVTGIPGKEDTKALAESEYRAFVRFQQWIKTLATERLDCQIIVKPHPAEDVRMWSGFLDNIYVFSHIMFADYVFNLFSISDLHVGRVECLTIPEAWIMRKPTIQCWLGDVGLSGSGEEARMVDGYVNTVEQFINGIDVTLGIEWEDDMPVYKELSDYNAKWLGPMPNSAERVATAIAELLDSKKPKSWKDPSDEDMLNFHGLLASHSYKFSVPQIDHLGQFSKNCRLEDIENWVRKIWGVIYQNAQVP